MDLHVIPLEDGKAAEVLGGTELYCTVRYCILYYMYHNILMSLIF